MKLFSILFIAILFWGCNKNSTDTFTIKGQINDSKTGIGQGNVSIKVYEVASFGANSGVSLIGTGSSNTDGSYEVVLIEI